jgi:hypothetical protein
MTQKEMIQKIGVGVAAAVLGAYVIKYLKGQGLL